jgi:hypothetical protein
MDKLSIAFVCGSIVMIVFMALVRMLSSTIGYPSRENINQFVLDNMSNSKQEKIFNIYDGYTKNRQITNLIVMNALSKKIPINLFFALAYAESNFKSVRSRTNSDGSYDIGLFQLNSYVYKKYDDSELIDPVFNTHMASLHLLNNYERFKSWEEAIMAYNCGNIKSIPERTAKYLSKILKFEQELNEVMFENFK